MKVVTGVPILVSHSLNNVSTPLPSNEGRDQKALDSFSEVLGVSTPLPSNEGRDLE